MQISSLDLTMQYQTDRILDISQQVSSATEPIFGNTRGQASSQHEELANTIVDVSGQTDEVYQKIETGQQELTTIKELSEQTIEASKEMQSNMDELFNIINHISSIISGIDNISMQTNLLALNASVEAARAGTAGKGFAVVANEVKQLATKSAQAAKSAVEMAGNTKTIIQTGVEMTSNTAEALQAISSVSSQISNISNRLVIAVKGQESALSLMEERIDAISDIANRNLQSAGGTEQSSELLAKEAENLQFQVKKFVLKEEHDK